MSAHGEWWESYFDDRFIELYSPHLPDELTRAEAAAVAEILALAPGARVLDLGCGWGRHAVELARLGHEVVGVDQSGPLLARAAALAARARVEVEWVRADMRDIAWRGEFDAVLSLFSSLGYSLRDADDLRALEAARAALRPGGSLVLETMHRDQVVREFAERDWWEGGKGEPVWVERDFDPILGVSREWLRWLERGKVGEKYHEIRVRTATEWLDLLRRAGLGPRAWYGDWDLSPFEHGSARLIVLADRTD